MPADKPNRKLAARKRRLTETIEILSQLEFGPKQRNEIAAYTIAGALPDILQASSVAVISPLAGETAGVTCCGNDRGKIVMERQSFAVA
jgi:type II restriction enzyme